jgi:hypothetical protein
MTFAAPMLIPLASPAPAGEVARPQAVTEGVTQSTIHHSIPLPSPRGVAGETSPAQACNLTLIRKWGR